MKVCAVTVTYGNRFHLLKQVIKACFKEGVDRMIIVDNASNENSKKQLKKYEENNERIKVIYLDKNTGSAGGYKRGLQEAYKDPICEFIWLLDDDNKPSMYALRALLKFWDELEEREKKKKMALLSIRSSRETYKKV